MFDRLLPVLLVAGFFLPAVALAAPAQTPPAPPLWQSSSVQHFYGLPDTKAHQKGTLVLTGEALTFTSKSSNTTIPRSSIGAVSAGNERIELWGTGGQVLRMFIPEGGGLVAATVMHHRVDMLTVEFHDGHDVWHSAVFFLPAQEAERALADFAGTPFTPHPALPFVCEGRPIEPGSVVVDPTNWEHAEVPAAYRALVYEHLVDRLRVTKGVGHVYRPGELRSSSVCPQFTIRTSIEVFKPGNQIKRAALGPVGMFVGTTQMSFTATFSDSTGRLQHMEQIKASVRSQSESTGVATKVSKSIAKHYAMAIRTAEEKNAAIAH
ncbi:MAG: hypothetical protein PW792_00775 [Acidobacteriaceae bacterium]|nr:hypothetical protein [Acidobacteriaceae bacterium]